ncbi:hypothetical protein [uncultured Clostridium sp.]|uniref:hypothetical protein n=1 Tax=uncultured Clostridium sp. TaxID=59620 RepID=UPI0025FCB8F3|nr:hypothetical protein [uncultured Clostridium sp.]
MQNKKDNKCSSNCNCEPVCNCDQSISSTLKAETNTKLSSGCNKKDAGNNAWSSVAQNYNVAESCAENKKDAGNNQWCSTNK